jgi:Carboxypeptidase regulatory-like domain
MQISIYGLRSICVVSCFAALVLTMTLTPVIFGQSATTGALTGTVRDSSGAVVPNASVTVTSIATGQVRTTTTSANGTYTVGLLPPGDYQVKFQASGFTVAFVSSVTINVTETPVLDQALSVGSQAQQVEVRADTEAVQTASSTVGTVINSQALTDIPLTTRNYTNLLGLTAGANVGVFDAANMGRGTQDIAVNGSATTQNNYQQDGAPVSLTMGNDGFIGSGAGTSGGGSNPGIGAVSPDAIQEFKIQTSLFDAGYGRKPGANVDVVTKSGTNQFHGTAFEFFRNTDLNANDFFRKISPPIGGVPQDGRQVLNQNQYGGTFGGPVKKDKLFFFASYQETWQKNGFSPAGFSTPTLVGIPLGDRSNTAAFKAALGAAFCPGGSATAGTTGKTSNGGVQVACNGSNINPVAINILQLKAADGTYFIPSSTTGVNQNVLFSSPAKFTEHQAIGNLDYVLNDRNTLSLRWFYGNDLTLASRGCGTTAAAVTLCVPGDPGEAQILTQYWVGRVTSSLTNNLVNEARISIQRVPAYSINQTPFTDTQVGIAPIIPSVNILNTTTVSGLFTWSSPGPSQAYASSWEAADQVSWSHGKHTIRAGFEEQRDRYNYHSTSFAVGTETFQTFQDFLLGLPGCAPSLTVAQCTASGTAGLTNGTFTSNISSSGTSTSVLPPGGLKLEFRAPAANAFVQDDVKIRSNLTLNLGLRWEYDGLQSEASGNNTNIWPNLINTVNTPSSVGTSAATGTLAGFVVPSNFNFSIYPVPPVGGLFQNNKRIATQGSPSKVDFAPRVGFAWKPLSTDRFVVRSGAGYFYDRIATANYWKAAVQATPYAVPVFQSAAANYFSTEAQPYAPTSLGWSPRWVNFATGTSSNLSDILVYPRYLTPLTYQWNLNIQYEFRPRWVLEVGYVGIRAIHQVPDPFVISSLEHELNEAQLVSPSNPICQGSTCITTNTTQNAQLRVPYLGFSPGGLGAEQTFGDGKFNNLQATVRKQFSHGLTFQAAYTYGRGVTTTSYVAFNDPDQPLRYGLNPSYRPQRFTINYSWDLPFGDHDGFVGKIASGWNLSGVTVVQDGLPLTPTDTRGGAIYGFGPGTAVTSTAEFASGMGNANVGSSGSLEQRLGGSVLGGPGYFNKSAFGTIPNVGAVNGVGGGVGWGNSGYGIILGPGQFNWDMALVKTTKVGGIREGATLQFRTEFFNAFNHPQFSNPAVVDVSKSNFGQITSTSVNPRLIQFALKYAF